MPETSLSQLVVLSLAGEEYALPIRHVQEIIRYSEPRPVALPQAWLRDSTDLRGSIVPACDLAVRLAAQREHDAGAKIVVVETAEGMVGMIVDGVDEVPAPPRLLAGARAAA